MTGAAVTGRRDGTGQAGPGRPGQARDGWPASLPELAVAACLIAVTCIAVYAYDGAEATGVAVIVWAAALLVLMRGLLAARSLPPTRPPETMRGTAGSGLTGYWRMTLVLRDGAASMASYDAELRPTLQHLVAARLAERHEVNFYADPAAARQLLLGGGGADALWFWLDPDRPAETGHERAGIPERTLTAILNRLERL